MSGVPNNLARIPSIVLRVAAAKRACFFEFPQRPWGLLDVRAGEQGPRPHRGEEGSAVALFTCGGLAFRCSHSAALVLTICVFVSQGCSSGWRACWRGCCLLCTGYLGTECSCPCSCYAHQTGKTHRSYLPQALNDLTSTMVSEEEDWLGGQALERKWLHKLGCC